MIHALQDVDQLSSQGESPVRVLNSVKSLEERETLVGTAFEQIHPREGANMDLVL